MVKHAEAVDKIECRRSERQLTDVRLNAVSILLVSEDCRRPVNRPREVDGIQSPDSTVCDLASPAADATTGIENHSVLEQVIRYDTEIVTRLLRVLSQDPIEMLPLVAEALPRAAPCPALGSIAPHPTRGKPWDALENTISLRSFKVTTDDPQVTAGPAGVVRYPRTRPTAVPAPVPALCARRPRALQELCVLSAQNPPRAPIAAPVQR